MGIGYWFLLVIIIYSLIDITIYSLCEKSTEKRSKKTRLRALFQSLMWSADPIIINNDDIRDYFEDKDNIGGNCYNCYSYWHDYSAIQLMFNMLVIQLVLKQIQIYSITLGEGVINVKKILWWGCSWKNPCHRMETGTLIVENWP